MKKIKKYQIPFGPLAVQQWGSQWRERLQPSAKSKVLQEWNGTGKKPKPESPEDYTKRRINEETKRTWRSDAADIAHGIGEGILALHPYTAIPYFGAKVGQDFLNGTYGWHTALNASVPLFHLAPAPASVGTVVDNALEDAANAGSKTARNLRVSREVKRQVSNNNPILQNTYKNPAPIVITEEARKVYTPTKMNFSKTSFPKLDMYKGAFPIKISKPFEYDALSNMFIPNKNYYYRRGWGIIDDAIKTGRIRVPEGDYKSIALKKYPQLDNGNPFSTSLMNHKFPYFSEGELWDAMGKYGVEPEDLIAVPKNVPGVQWVGGSKWGELLKDKAPSEVGGRATPLINGEINQLPTQKSYLFKYIDGKYKPLYKQGGKMNILEFLKKGSGIHIKKENRGNNDYINKMLNEIWKKN